MKLLVAGFLLMASVAWAGDFQQAKVLDVQAGTVANTSPLGRWAASDGGSMVIPATKNVMLITVAIGDLNYTAQYQEQRHFKPSDLTIGEMTPVRVDGDKLTMKGSDGKEVKGRITRKGRAQ